MVHRANDGTNDAARRTSAMSSNQVRTGQQYSAAGSDSVVWQVLAVSPDPNGILHARLCNVERPYELKTLTCSVLADRLFYRLLAEDSEAGVAVRAIRQKLPRRKARGLSPAA
jgi:hypothetical protein